MYPLIRNALILLCALLPLAVQAVTLGEARVKSYLNQPLEVEIDLVGVAAGQNEQLRLRLANQEHFDRLGIAYLTLLEDLSFDVVREGNRWLVRARSDRPITEPFLDFPLLMTWPGGQMVRQYTLLLDPPRPIRPARAGQTSRATRAVRPPPAAATAPVTSPAAESYGPVRRGETLWPIAQQLKPAGITTRQMAMALLRANPQAFIDNNVNKLRAGAVLTIPSLAFIEELDPQTARAQFAAQTKRRQPAVATSPRSLPAAPVQPAAEPAPEPPAREQAAQATVEPPEDTEKSDPQLRIVSEKAEQTDGETATEKDLQEKLLVTMEEIESNRLTTDAIESRLARLEAEIDRMQKLVELKDAQIAALQSEVETRDDLEAAARAAEPPPPALAVAESDTASTIDTAPVTAPTPAVTIEAATPAAAPTAATKTWQEQYLWVLWIIIAILGLTVLALLLRRPQQAATEPAAAELPPVAASAATASKAPAPEASDMRSAEQDFRALADAQLPDSEPSDAVGAELPEVDREHISDIDRLEDHEELTDSVLAEMLEESRLVPEAPTTSDSEADFDDDDIASWIKELGHESEPAESHSANDEQLGDDEIPSILTELDDQLGSTNSPEIAPPPSIHLEPVDDPVAEPPLEDDTFKMSLDLARAYLEIGDQEGAKDMLKQALAGTRNPEHRQQIQELLEQID